jgi:hypothetical protein
MIPGYLVARDLAAMVQQIRHEYSQVPDSCTLAFLTAMHPIKGALPPDAGYTFGKTVVTN